MIEIELKKVTVESILTNALKIFLSNFRFVSSIKSNISEIDFTLGRQSISPNTTRDLKRGLFWKILLDRRRGDVVYKLYSTTVGEIQSVYVILFSWIRYNIIVYDMDFRAWNYLSPIKKFWSKGNIEMCYWIK